jgi:transposase
VHAFGFEPSLERFAGIRTKLGKHLSFDHVHENTLGAGGAAALHALGKRLGALAREASERVLREVAWHENSESELEFKYSIKGYFTKDEAHARNVFEGIFWILSSGARWQDLPEEVPSTTTYPLGFVIFWYAFFCYFMQHLAGFSLTRISI